MAKKIVAGNWKMNLNAQDAQKLMSELNNAVFDEEVRVIVFPPSLYVERLAELSNSKIDVGTQNFHQKSSGAYTGEISIEQIKSVGANIGLIGHSERREYFKEDHELLKSKVDAALAQNFEFIFCCGEPLNIRETGREFEYVKGQLEESLFHISPGQMKNRIIAYEPVWAIGTGKTASSQQAEEMHAAIRSWLTEAYDEEIANSVSILYGGSCKPTNAQELFACANVDGGLIGGAALQADSFVQIINSY